MVGVSQKEAQLLNLGFLVHKRSATWVGVTVELCGVYRQGEKMAPAPWRESWSTGLGGGIASSRQRDGTPDWVES
jgi:hypothetical protein